jgi:hypothetical protein
MSRGVVSSREAWALVRESTDLFGMFVRSSESDPQSARGRRGLGRGFGKSVWTHDAKSANVA